MLPILPVPAADRGPRLLPLLRQALASPGVDLIEVPVDYGDDDWLLNEEIPRLSAALE